MEAAEIALESGKSLRSVARRIGVSHVALLKRIRARKDAELANDNDDGWGQFDATDVAIILAVADAGIPGGMTELARYMECSLSDVVEVCVAYLGNANVLR